MSFELYPLLDPLLDYEVKSLLDDPNILRDSVLIQMKCLYFEAYVHVGAIMWRVVFKELRGLINSKGLELNPMTLNWYHHHFAPSLTIHKLIKSFPAIPKLEQRLYEQLYDLAQLLQTDNSLPIFEVKSWPI